MVIFHFKNISKKKPQTIGVCGIERNCGTTHLALALSNFLCNKQNYKTAYIELNASKQVSHLSSGKNVAPFQIYGVDVYPQVTLQTLPLILEKNYAYSILDMGVLNENTYREFLRCNKKLVIGYSSAWKIPLYESMLKSHQYQSIDQKSIIWLGNLGTKQSITQLGHRNHIHILAVPFLENPFHLTPSDWTFLNSLLKKI